MEVKSVYNFVPAPMESEVVKPEWADKVSHDQPFEDGVSGVIEFELKAETPLFIKHGYTKVEEEELKKNKSPLEFNHKYNSDQEKEYFIPGTSIKGMVRSTMEIFTRSRINIDLINDHRYGFRDLNNNQYRQQFNPKNDNPIKCGWLSINKENEWEISNTGMVYWIRHEEIDKKLESILSNEFQNERYDKNNPIQKTAKHKYDLMSKKNLKKNLNGIYKEEKSSSNTVDKRSFVVNADESENGSFNGRIVFTGQSGQRKKIKRKGKDVWINKGSKFIFPDQNGGELVKLIVNESVVKDFKFIYFDHDRVNISLDWEHWREKLQKGNKIPVFFKEENGEIKHFGLSYMYKLPLDNSVKKMEPIASYNTDKKDFSETVFGKVDNANSVKGRVSFGHFSCTKNMPTVKPTKVVSSSPKASFYPFYLKGVNIKESLPYSDNQELIGIKRYPVHNTIKEADANWSENIGSIINPLSEGTEFRGKLRFQNLKPVELGGILSAATKHQNKYVYHSVGGLKGYGYGKCTFNIASMRLVENQKVKYYENETITNKVREYLKAFEEYMDAHIEGGNWKDLDSIKEEIAMSRNPKNDNLLIYPDLEEFRKITKEIKDKDHNTGMKAYSEYNSSSKKIESFTDAKQVEEWEKTEKMKALSGNLPNLEKKEYAKKSFKKGDHIIVEVVDSVVKNKVFRVKLHFTDADPIEKNVKIETNEFNFVNGNFIYVVVSLVKKGIPKTLKFEFDPKDYGLN